VPAAVGAILVAVAYSIASPPPALAVAAAFLIIVFRLVALWRGWHAPSAR
jgi:hypothetical protein